MDFEYNHQKKTMIVKIYDIRPDIEACISENLIIYEMLKTYEADVVENEAEKEKQFYDFAKRFKNVSKKTFEDSARVIGIVDHYKNQLDKILREKKLGKLEKVSYMFGRTYERDPNEIYEEGQFENATSLFVN